MRQREWKHVGAPNLLIFHSKLHKHLHNIGVSPRVVVCRVGVSFHKFADGHRVFRFFFGKMWKIFKLVECRDIASCRVEWKIEAHWTDLLKARIDDHQQAFHHRLGVFFMPHPMARRTTNPDLKFTLCNFNERQLFYESFNWICP